MKNIHWFEAKQLDRVTNFSTEIEIIKAANKHNITFKYYCTYNKSKKYYNLKKNINYLGITNNKYVKFLSFNLFVFFISLKLILYENNNIIMVNQDLVKSVMFSNIINRLFGKTNKFIIDIRTTPTVPSTFKRDMSKFHFNFGLAIKYFDGYSFITPFMKNVLLEPYITEKPSVTWSSGVDLNLFKISNFKKTNSKNPFTLFYHGGISESRGNLTLIQACEILINKGIDIRLIQVGICVDQSIVNYINENNLNSWCELLPPVPLEKIPQYITNSDLPILPFPNFMAWRVSSPIKLMEYLAMGKKVLAPNIEAFTDVFENNEELIFYYDINKDNQKIEIANQIELIIKNDGVSNFEKKKAVNFVSKNFTWEIQAKKLFNYCNQI